MHKCILQLTETHPLNQVHLTLTPTCTHTNAQRSQGSAVPPPGEEYCALGGANAQGSQGPAVPPPGEEYGTLGDHYA